MEMWYILINPNVVLGIRLPTQMQVVVALHVHGTRTLNELSTI